MTSVRLRPTGVLRVLAVGYRVRSHRGTQFRIWATQRLHEYLVKGFAMDDARLKRAGDEQYFEELLARIRDIRSSERVFWRKVLDIYATSIDYDPQADASELFFKTVQNKMHWAAHGHTAAEIIHQRIDAEKPNLGLTAIKGKKPTKQDISVAKNYLTEDELNILNRMVTAYLEVAELQALNRHPMNMSDWAERLNDFLGITGSDILQNAGTVSHDQALQKAEAEYKKFREQTRNEISEVEKHYLDQIEAASKKLTAKT